MIKKLDDIALNRAAEVLADYFHNDFNLCRRGLEFAISAYLFAIEQQPKDTDNG